MNPPVYDAEKYPHTPKLHPPSLRSKLAIQLLTPLELNVTNTSESVCPVYVVPLIALVKTPLRTDVPEHVKASNKS